MQLIYFFGELFVQQSGHTQNLKHIASKIQEQQHFAQICWVYVLTVAAPKINDWCNPVYAA